MLVRAILGSGYIGKELAKKWADQGIYVRCSTTTKEKFEEIRTLTPEVHLLFGHDLKSVVHFIKGAEALVVTVAPRKAADYEETYLKTAQSLVKACKDLPYLIYTSSTSIYGDCAGEWVNEKDKVNPETDSGYVLAATEKIYQSLLPSSCKLCILRLGGIYGPGRSWEDRIIRFQGKTLAGNGGSYTNMIHQLDVINAIDWCVRNQVEGVYNLVNDSHLTRKSFYDQLAKEQGVATVKWDPSIQSVHAGNKKVCNKKIKEAGFCFSFPQF